MKVVKKTDLINELEHDIGCKISTCENSGNGKLTLVVRKKGIYHTYLLDTKKLYTDSYDYTLNKKIKTNINLLRQLRDYQLSDEQVRHIAKHSGLSSGQITKDYGVNYARQVKCTEDINKGD